MRQRLRRLLASWLLAVVAVAAAAGSAFAHAEADRADPPIGGTVATAPTEVRVWFTQELFRRQGANTLEVYDAAGNRVDNDDARIDDDDRTLMIATLPAGLAAGEYTVRLRSLSVDDGHPWEGEFTFTVLAAADATPTAMTEVTATATTPPVEPTAVAATPAPADTVLPDATATPAPASSAVPCIGGAVLFGLPGLMLLRRRQHNG